MPLKNRVEDTTGNEKSKCIKIVEEKKMEKEKSQENADCMCVWKSFLQI